MRKSIIGSMISDENTTNIVIKPVEKKESRSQRVNILLKPSVYKAAKVKCKKLNISVNECINQFLENWISEEN